MIKLLSSSVTTANKEPLQLVPPNDFMTFQGFTSDLLQTPLSIYVATTVFYVKHITWSSPLNRSCRKSSKSGSSYGY